MAMHMHLLKVVLCLSVGAFPNISLSSATSLMKNTYFEELLETFFQYLMLQFDYGSAYILRYRIICL